LSLSAAKFGTEAVEQALDKQEELVLLETPSRDAQNPFDVRDAGHAFGQLSIRPRKNVRVFISGRSLGVALWDS